MGDTKEHRLELCGVPSESGKCRCCGTVMEREECTSTGMQQLGMYWLICPVCPVVEQ